MVVSLLNTELDTTLLSIIVTICNFWGGVILVVTHPLLSKNFYSIPPIHEIIFLKVFIISHFPYLKFVTILKFIIFANIKKCQ